MEILASALDMVRRVLGRFYLMLGPLLLDPFDLLDRLFGLQIDAPTWTYWSLFGLGLFTAVALAFHEVRTISAPQALKPTLDSLIGEGESLRLKAGITAEPPPRASFDHWRIRVRHYLEENFEGGYSLGWQESVREGVRAREGFSGAATPEQFELWNQIQSGIEWLQGLNQQVRN